MLRKEARRKRRLKRNPRRVKERGRNGGGKEDPVETGWNWGKVPVVLFLKEWEEEEEEVGFGAKEQSMQEHFPFLRVPNGDGPPHNFP